MRNGDEESIEKFDEWLFAPPAGLKKEVIAESTEWAPEAQGANFLAQLAARGGKERTSG